ncbi:MAG: hypothetical protein WA137_01915 [Methanothrix sp.]
MEIDERRVSFAAAFLDGKDYAIHKVTRAGFTTSFVIAAGRSNKRVLLVSPTRKIISDTMKGADNGLVGIYGNAACQYNQNEIAKEPLLEHLPMSLPGKCDKCKYAADCHILDIEREPDAPMKSLTAAKLEAIMVSDSERAQALREILRDIDVILLDEAHTLVTSDVAKVPHNEDLHNLKQKIAGFPLLLIAQRKWTELRMSSKSEVDDLWTQVEQDPDNWLVRELKVPWTLTLDEQRKIWGELKKLAKAHTDLNVTEEEVIQLRDIIEILSHDTARLSYISGKGTVGQILVCGALGRMNSAISNYLKNYAKNASVVFVSGTLFEPYPDFFRGIAGRDKFMGVVARPLSQATFPDLCNTNSKMTIYADSNRLSGTTRQKHSRILDIIERIKEISEAKGNAPIHVLAPNIELYMRLRQSKELKDYPNLFWDYYRSANTMGVESDRRIIIAIGLAEVPKNAYDCLANSYIESQTIRVGSVDAATWQAWSRAKDPKGETPSEVYCIGVKAEDIDRVLTWGPGRRIVRQGNYGYGVVCEEELTKPAIMTPFKKQVHAGQRKASPYIKKAWDVEGDLAGKPDSLLVYELENPNVQNAKTTYIHIRGNSKKNVWDSAKVKCFGAIYSNPENSEQLQITIATLDKFFRSKTAQHAEQRKQPDNKGRFGYRPHMTQDWPMLVFDMLYDGRTPATYGMGEDGLTVQCAFDIDNHAGNNPARTRVLATKSCIEGLGAQALIVASGSADSYHVHIPILRTPIETSHDFLKTMLNELKQGHKDLDWHDTETFPKQSNKDRIYGNALKLPLAINNKTGQRSEILDDDLEPVDVMFITKVIELREPVKEAEKVGERMFLPARLSPHTVSSSSPTRSRSMRPCIVAALDEQLDGGEGHDMRLAVVCEALASGKSRAEIIRLFAGQADYDEAITAKNVDYVISRGYHPWKCETIRARCSSLVDCSQCPHNTIRDETTVSEVLVEPAMAR